LRNQLKGRFRVTPRASIIERVLSIGIVLIFDVTAALAADFTTPAERAQYQRTATYDETVDYFQRLEKASGWVKLTQFGTSPQGRALNLVIVSSDKAFTPEKARKTGKVILLVQNSIHAGEVDGTDASMALVRDIAVTKERATLLDSVILLIIPIFNVDGHENTARFTRPNQDGPENAGFRATAQLLNLNRDYLKADTPEMRAWLAMWHQWMPDFFVDDHISDGADWQYTVCYTVPVHPNAPESIREWTRTIYDPDVKGQVERAGYKTFPYAFLRGGNLQAGVSTYVDSPRLSTGYTILWNRPGVLIEMHSLKDFRTRVLGNYAMLAATLDNLNHNATSLKRAIAQADSQTAAGLTDAYPLSFRPDGDSVMVDFAGYEYDTLHSDATDGRYPRYRHDKPRTWRIPYFGTFKPRVTVVPPRAYLIPCEWNEQIDRLHLHGIHLDSLTGPLTAKVERYYLDSLKWSPAPYENHIQPRYRAVVHETTMTFPSGTVIVDLHQPGAKVAIQALEPQGSDSWVAWGLWNTIFERKEYIEDYVIDPLADSMLTADPKLKADFDSRLKSDTTFAKSVDARRQFFYERSRFAETQVNWYPVARLLDSIPVVTPINVR
jgi:hypothetical protein